MLFVVLTRSVTEESPACSILKVMRFSIGRELLLSISIARVDLFDDNDGEFGHPVLVKTCETPLLSVLPTRTTSSSWSLNIVRVVGHGAGKILECKIHMI